MTQESAIRTMLHGFVSDPPDSEYQQGFLAAVCVIANEIMGFDWNDKLLLAAEGCAVATPEAAITTQKIRPVLEVIKGGKSESRGED